MKKIIILSLFVLFSIVILNSCKGPTEGAFLTIQQSQCMGCARCTDVCATNAITMINGKAIIDPATCIECGKCVTICPVDAIY